MTSSLFQYDAWTISHVFVDVVYYIIVNSSDALPNVLLLLLFYGNHETQKPWDISIESSRTESNLANVEGRESGLLSLFKTLTKILV